MLDLFNIAKPQGCDIQIFTGNPPSTTTLEKFMWNKPRGVSHVYMMLIGAGGDGNPEPTNGGSAAVTVWYGAAQHVPDSLSIQVAYPSSITTLRKSIVYYRGTSRTVLLEADGGVGGASGGTGGVAFDANQFTASGFFRSTAGQDASSGGVPTTTFLSAGTSSIKTTNYGYSTTGDGFFQLQPIIVGCGGAYNGTTFVGGVGGIGCGGAGSVGGGSGGRGMVLIASW